VFLGINGASIASFGMSRLIHSSESLKLLARESCI
jgi:hypothetical protein